MRPLTTADGYGQTDLADAEEGLGTRLPTVQPAATAEHHQNQRKDPHERGMPARPPHCCDLDVCHGGEDVAGVAVSDTVAAT